jgi:hypothetical protein
VTRFVDRGAIIAAFIGIGVALTVGVSFLLVIPVEPVYALLALPSGLLIGYYANARAGRDGGPWTRILANSIAAGFLTAVTMALLLLAVKALFFSADDGYRDPGLGGRLTCQTGADCVYRRYLDAQGAALAEAGLTDVASFSRFYWDQQLGTASSIATLALAGAAAGGVAFGAARGRRREAGEGPAGS